MTTDKEINAVTYRPPDHKIWISDPDEHDRVHWECSCGLAGSSRVDLADIASDRHIRPGESRSDISKPAW